MQRADVVAGTAVAALGAFALVTALNLAFLSDSGVPGPGFFPTLLSGLLVVLGVVLGVISLRKRPATAPDTGAETEEPPDNGVHVLRADTAADSTDIGAGAGSPGIRARVLRAGGVADSPDDRARVLRAGTVWVCFLVAVPVLTYLGFVPAMAILVALLLFGVERRLNWRSLVVAVVVPVGVYELFVHLLGIPLPTGVFALGPFSS